MHPEQLAKKMRERALADTKTIILREEVWPEEAKAIYYHAGRYAAGAKDNKARTAYFDFLFRESNSGNIEEGRNA